MAEKRKDSKGRNLLQGEVQRKDGRFMYRYTDANGVRKSVYSWDLAELRVMEAEIQQDLKDGISTDKKITLNDMQKKNVELRTDWKETTRGTNLYLYKHFVSDTIGRKKIAEIKKSDIKRFYNTLVKNGLTANTIHNIQTAIHPVFSLAVDDDIIRKNPSDGVVAEIRKSHGLETGKRHALTEEQQNKLLDFLNQSEQYNHWLNIVTVFLGTGCRVGEVIGLRWCDCDFRNGMISVNHNCVYIPYGENSGQFRITTPKTNAGIREIPMMDGVKKALLREREKQFRNGGANNAVVYDESGNEYSGFIFSNRYNNICNPYSLNRAMQRVVEACNKWEQEKANKEHREAVVVPRFSVHQLRHTFCTRFCENETNVKVIQEIMGHKDIQTTLNVYAEATREKKQRTMENLEGKFRIS